MTPEAAGTHAVSRLGASPLMFHWDGALGGLRSVGTTGNKGEKKYQGSCSGESDSFVASTSLAMGEPSSLAMGITRWENLLKYWPQKEKRKKREVAKEEQSTFQSSHSGQRCRMKTKEKKTPYWWK